MQHFSCLKLEVIAAGLDDAIAAAAGGADRIELVAARERGGLTPSLKTIETVMGAVSIPVYVMARPHDRGFIYRGADEAALLRDVTAVASLRPAAIVTGAIDEHGAIDLPLLRDVLDVARGTTITFHRAFDALADRSAGYDVLADFPQITRVLTSGGAADAWAGRDVIASLVKKKRGPIVLPGSGITTENARALIEATGVTEIHVGNGACIDGVVNAKRVAAIKELL
jgi:copper homeostasis protein